MTTDPTDIVNVDFWADRIAALIKLAEHNGMTVEIAGGELVVSRQVSDVFIARTEVQWRTDPAVEPAPPSADQAALRDWIVAAIKASPFEELRTVDHAPNGPLQITVKVDDLADVLLRRLPPPADRGAVLREAADFAAAFNSDCLNCAVELEVATGLRRMAAEAQQQPAPACPDPIECGHEAALGEAQQEIRDLREKHKASLRHADKVNNELMEEVQRYAIGTERPVLWSVYNRMHSRASHADAALNRVRRIARRLAAHAAGFKDVLDASDSGPWGRTVGADIAELIEALSDPQSAVVAAVAGEAPAGETVHGCPPDGSGLTPCCGRTPFELPLSDRISSEAPITCTGPSAAVSQPGKEPRP